MHLTDNMHMVDVSPCAETTDKKDIWFLKHCNLELKESDTVAHACKARTQDSGTRSSQESGQ